MNFARSLKGFKALKHASIFFATTGGGLYLVSCANSSVLSDTKNTAAAQFSTKPVTYEELQAHKSLDKGLWVSIDRKVYDLTDFVDKHPGGSGVLMKHAGSDVTKLFQDLHPPNVLDVYLSSDKHVGTLVGDIKEDADETDETGADRKLPSLSKIIGITDFEYVAKNILTERTWAYYSGGADDNYTLRENRYAFSRIFFNPRVLRNSTEPLDMTTEMLGVKTEAPFYCSAAASQKLGHPDGELSIARACGSEGIFQMISNASSYSFDEITDERKPGQSQWFQLYVKPDRKISYDTIRKCEEKGIKAIFVTVDSSLVGGRSKDYKLRYDTYNDEDEDLDPMKNFKDSGLNWTDIDNFRKFTKIPIVLKGVQCKEDVILAAEKGISAVVLSNHGGRQLDFARPPVEVLAEVMPALRERNLHDKIEVYIDGGVRRGTDIVKALCLGAKGVGLGRAFVYANSTYGEKGVKRAIQLLKSEVFIAMKLLGVNNIKDLRPELLDLRGLNSRKNLDDAVYDAAYDSIKPAGTW